MTLQLIKVEEGLAQGNVLYHSFSKCRKTPSPLTRRGSCRGVSPPSPRVLSFFLSPQDGGGGEGDPGAEGGEAEAESGAAAEAGGGRGAQAAAA